MARRSQQPISIFESLNLVLFGAWEHGARHLVLRPQDKGIEITYLGPDGSEHVQRLPLPYKPTLRCLHQLNARFGRVHLNMGGHEWNMDIAEPARSGPD